MPAAFQQLNLDFTLEDLQVLLKKYLILKYI